MIGSVSNEMCIILAAGKSTRLKEIAGDLPKPMVKFLGKPLIQYNIELIKSYNINEVIINLHYNPNAIVEFFESHNNFDIDVSFSYEEEILGTAGGIKKLEDRLKERFIVIYGDNLINLNIDSLIRSHESSGCIATIALFDKDVVPNTCIVGGKVLIDESGIIKGFKEGCAVFSKDGNYINSGVYVFEKEVLDYIPKALVSDFGHDIFPKMLANGIKINSYFIDGFCIGVDSPEIFRKAEVILTNFIPFDKRRAKHF